jgi:hypothetical protein
MWVITVEAILLRETAADLLAEPTEAVRTLGRTVQRQSP